MTIRIAAFRLLCPDVGATAGFYGAALGAEAAVATGDTLSITLGRGTIEFGRAAARTAPAPSNSTVFQHLAIVVSDMDAAMARLSAIAGWTPISRAGPERLPAASGGVTAFKFRDPDGHPLELLAFPPETAPAAWRGCAGLFLGIDHSAITVGDIARSIAFYGDLGFVSAAGQVNRGIEQERMDDADEATVDVVPLLPPGDGPHLELLHYRVPGTFPQTVPDDDASATRILLVADGMPAAAMTDPDGHRLSIVTTMP